MLPKVYALFVNKSDTYFITESGRGISRCESKPGECCEQKRVLSSHCLDSHDERNEKHFEKLLLIYIFHRLLIYNYGHTYPERLRHFVCCTSRRNILRRCEEVMQHTYLT
jgi:hypothetical protein